MSKDELFEQLEEEVQIINSKDFELIVTETTSVPSHSDSNLTYTNFDDKVKKVKKLKTAILFIDIRKSSKISLQNSAESMGKLYSSFTRSMIKIAEFHGGYVRNIIGDRVMVVYDWSKCGTQAIETAISMNEFTKNVIDKNFEGNSIKCGIGIDSGEILVLKCGVIKKGSENAHYKNLTWAGTVANTASKLTDSANKYFSETKTTHGANVGFHYPYTDQWQWEFQDTETLVNNLKKGVTFSPRIDYPNEYFKTLFYMTKPEFKHISVPPILITSNVKYDIELENSSHDCLSKLKLIDWKIDNVEEKVYGLK